MIGGSDLDGDVFWVTWDARLVPQACEEPMQYTAPSLAITGINKDQVGGHACACACATA